MVKRIYSNYRPTPAEQAGKRGELERFGAKVRLQGKNDANACFRIADQAHTILRNQLCIGFGCRRQQAGRLRSECVQDSTLERQRHPNLMHWH